MCMTDLISLRRPFSCTVNNRRHSNPSTALDRERCRASSSWSLITFVTDTLSPTHSRALRMAARHEEELKCRTECENCGATEALLRCSRCRAAWFCSLKCHKAYWPFHKDACRSNDFADAMEPHDAKFARWMRHHGKLAVLKDAEVERLEAAAKAPSGPLGGQQEVVASMYGRASPAPKQPSYSAEEVAALAAAQQAQGALQAAVLSAQQRAWQELSIPQGLGLECSSIVKWRQSQSHVEVFVWLPETAAARQVRVELAPGRVGVWLLDTKLLAGMLAQDIKVEESTWFIESGVLCLSLLKRNRRGHYANRCTNADTFWRALLAGAPPAEQLQATPPLAYYWSSYDAEDLREEAMGGAHRS